jgi:GNAT superfamily N-acetyltransferase
MPPPTPALRLQDQQSIEALLDQDPVATAVVWNRGFDMEGEKDVYVDGDPPRAVLAIVRPKWAEGAAGVALHALDPRAATDVMPAWPRGPVFFHLSEEWMLSLVEPRMESWDGSVFWLFELDRRDFLHVERHDVQPLGPEWAGVVGKTWDPGWNQAEDYVRTRIKAGHAYAVFQEGKPVAWALTHLETPKVSMMGFLHVLEPYRRKGYARALSSVLAKDILDRGKIPALHIKTDNVPSLGLTSSVGFHRVRKQVWGEAMMR